jgi:hypothetical protein
MSLEEQVTSLEKTAQEIIRAQEGTVASESNEEIGNPMEDIKEVMICHGSPVPIRDLPKYQAAQESKYVVISANPTGDETNAG